VDGPILFAARLGAGWGDKAVGGCSGGGTLLAVLIGKSTNVQCYNQLFVARAPLDLVGAVVLWVLLR
jgi:hypothetical protein